MNFLTLFSIFSLGAVFGCATTALWISVGEMPLKPSLKPVSFADLPGWNPSLSNTEQGFYKKFYVHRVDESDMPGGKHEDCDYLVLDLTHDPYALETTAYYARACKETHPLLHKDLMRRVNSVFETMENEGKL